MGTTRAELKRKMLMGFKDLQGEDILMAEEAINDACHCIAEVQNFEELVVLDTTSALTVHGTKRYHLTTDLLLTRPKDIMSLKVHDDFESRKLIFVPYQKIDEVIPYPEGLAEEIPIWYTRQGEYLEFIPIPNAIYPLHIRYSQWPKVLTVDTDQCSYTYIDRVIIALARDIFISLRAGVILDYPAKAKSYLDIAIDNDRSTPDALPIAQGFSTQKPIMGEYWNNPFVGGVR